MEPRPVYGALNLYRSRGEYLERLEQFEKAITAYDEALKWHPQDVKALTYSSRVRLKANKFYEAYRDEEKAAALNPANIAAQYMKAQSLYEMSEFEKSLGYSYRGYLVRKNPPYFLNGINQSSETIEDCIGVNAGNVMRDFYPLIKRSENLQNRGRETMEPETKPSFRQTQLLEKRKRAMAQKYLQQMASDKFYLESLVKDPRLESANRKGSDRLMQFANDAYNSLVQRQEVMRMRRPYYTIKLTEAMSTDRLRERKRKELLIIQQLNFQDAKKLVEKCRKFMNNKNTEQCFSHVDRAKTYLYGKSVKFLPEKDDLITDLFEIVGKAYLDQKRLSERMTDRANEKRVNYIFSAPISREPSLDSVIKHYPVSFMDIKQQIDSAEYYLKLTQNTKERLYLYHELARLYCQLKKNNLCKFYGRKCQQDSRYNDDVIWHLNANFIMIKNEILKCNRNEAKRLLYECLDLASEKYPDDSLVSFINKTIEMQNSELDEPDVDCDLEQREKKIVKIMVDPDMKAEASYLFKQMQSMPGRRRFSVMPGFKVGDEAPSAASRRMSIMPGPKEPKASTKKQKIIGFQDFDI